ncbi:MAG: ion transporter, partial [Lachnospiraceae bacterium]|nr:ion transporter [Lachnospiraceae bacterium]
MAEQPSGPVKGGKIDPRQLKRIQDHVFRIVEIGYLVDRPSRLYDVISVLAILVNLSAGIALTYDDAVKKMGGLLTAVEIVTVLFFAVDYALRIFSAPSADRKKTPWQNRRHYLLSFSGIIDLMSFLPYFLPVFVPTGLVAFRMIRVIRIFRLFRINAYYDSLNVITSVIKSKSQQLLSSVFIVLLLMMASSLCMYSVEHEAQPEVFANAFSGMWWAASTLLTVGYGDIYPVTTAGKALGIIISFLGVGMVAIPTGIISAGFVEQYTHLKNLGEAVRETDVRFLRVVLEPKDEWVGRTVKEIGLPSDLLVAAIQRKTELIVPHGEVVFEPRDKVILAAAGLNDGLDIDLKELRLKAHH